MQRRQETLLLKVRAVIGGESFSLGVGDTAMCKRTMAPSLTELSLVGETDIKQAITDATELENRDNSAYLIRII